MKQATFDVSPNQNTAKVAFLWNINLRKALFLINIGVENAQMPKDVSVLGQHAALRRSLIPPSEGGSHYLEKFARSSNDSYLPPAAFCCSSFVADEMYIVYHQVFQVL